MDPDPWKWSVQDVQQFFRNDAAAYISDMPYGRLPQLDPFLSALKDNDVTGVVLLTTIDATSLRDDCGVGKLAERSAVLRCITKLRRQSAIHGAQSTPFGLQTPPQQPLQAAPLQEPPSVPPTELVAPEATSLSTQHVEEIGKHVRSGEVEFEDSRGRKRRKLDLSKPDVSPKATRTLVDLTATTERKENFGELAFPVDEIFYGQTGFGREIGPLHAIGNVLVHEPDKRESLEDNNFQFTEQNKSIGESQYVFSHVLHFLNRFDKGLVGRRRGRQALGFLPYRDRPDLKTRSAMVLQFQGEGEEVVALREDAAYLLSGFELQEAPQQPPGGNEYLLEKYKPSEALPLYGDSENENDDDESDGLTTSDDAEQQAEEIDDSEDLDLTPTRCNEIIDDFVQEWSADWNNIKLPRLEEKKAWSVWKKTKQSRTIRDSLIQGAEARIQHFANRLAQMKAEMLRDTWQSEEKLRDACGVMEPTIEDREEQKWMIAVWGRRQEPAHVVRRGTHGKKSIQQTSASGEGDGRIYVHPKDLLSVSPAPVSGGGANKDADEVVQTYAADDSNGVIGDEVQYDADDEIRHTPANTAPISPDILDFVGPPSGENDLVNEEDGGDLPVGATDKDAASSTKDTNYEPTDEDSECELPSPSALVQFRSNKTLKKSTTMPIDLTMSSDSSTPKKPGRPPKKGIKKVVDPQGNPTEATAADVDFWDIATLIRSNDRQRILIKLLRDAGPKVRDRLDSILRSSNLGRTAFLTQLKAALRSLRNETMDANLQNDIAPTMMRAGEIYIRWLMPHVIEQGRSEFDKLAWEEVLNDGQLSLFTRMLGSILLKKASKLFVTLKSSPQKPGSSSVPIAVSSESGDRKSKQHQTPTKKRKKEVKRSAAAQDSRAMALNRQQRFNESQTTNSAQLEVEIRSDPSHSEIVINPAKKADDDFIYICDRIARKMKAHQIDGARFLWREVTAEGEEGAQGCILAHTMGLGKTMQTISLLAALNEAAASREPKVHKQLPPQLRPRDVHAGERQLRTLILCPPGILQNWRREINEWAPTKLGHIIVLGSPRKGTHDIDDWMRTGGVLLAGYQMYLSTLSPKQDQKNAKADEEIANLEKILLEGPEIVVADEAQAIKNDRAAISILVSRISTQSRIALTGTPMSNDVDEIYALMSWVAPGFLGDAREFHDHFKEPIKAGLYIESTAEQRRKSTKRLAGLHIEIQPKIDRANIEVLRGSLKPKIEYVITVPLTNTQDILYRKYINMLQSGNRTETASQLLLFGWMADLTLLTNHPQCLLQKLTKSSRHKVEKSKRDESGIDLTSRDQTPSTTESGAGTPLALYAGTDDENLAEDGTIAEAAASEELAALDPSEVQELLHYLPDSTDPSLSAKVTIFLKLLDSCLEHKDKALVFSSSIPTIDYLERALKDHGERFCRIDGKVKMDVRNEILKKFHNNGKFDTHGLNTMLVSSKAGGVGLNIQTANRVFIFDFGFNPTIEEQAIGRAYRLGQTKPVYVYRFVTGGTFETNIYNKQLFKSSLSARVVDKKNPRRNAERNARDYLYEPRDVPREDLTEEAGKDPFVLDRLLEQLRFEEEQGNGNTLIKAIKTMETLQEEAKDAPLDEEEQKEVNYEVEQRRPRGKRAANMAAKAPFAPMANVASSSRALSYPMPSPNTSPPPSTMGNGHGSQSLVTRLPVSATLRQALAAANGSGDTPHAHPMGGLPMPPKPSDGTN